MTSNISRTFPGLAGFSPANVWRMRGFYLAWTEEVLAQAVRELNAAKILGIRVLDHVIVTRKGHYSFQEAGLIR